MKSRCRPAHHSVVLLSCVSSSLAALDCFPAEITVAKIGAAITGDVKVSSLVIGANEILSVSLGSDSEWTLNSDTGSKIPYIVSLELESGTNADGFELAKAQLSGADGEAEILQASMDKRSAVTHLSITTSYAYTITDTGVHKDTLKFNSDC